MEFYKEVDPENSHSHTSGNSIYFVIRKKEKQEEFWPRITKEKLKYHYIKTDFDKWVDEDEQEEKAAEEDPMAGFGGQGGPGNFDLSQLAGGAGGAGGLGGLEGLGGLGGEGGAGGLDFSKLANLAGGGAGGAEGFDFSKLAEGAAVNPQATEEDFSSSDEDDKVEEAK